MKLTDLPTDTSQRELNPFYITFSDLMLLLCAFFVMILGMSKIDIGSFEMLRTGFTGSIKGTLVELYSKLHKLSVNQPGVNIRMAEDGVRLDLESAAFFDTGSAVLKTNVLKPLQPLLIEILKTEYKIDVEGHTDDRGLYKTFGEEIETNWSLSGRRASSVVHHLLGLGFEEHRVRIVGYAANVPIAPIRGKKGVALSRARAQNRRVSILVK